MAMVREMDSAALAGAAHAAADAAKAAAAAASAWNHREASGLLTAAARLARAAAGLMVPNSTGAGPPGRNINTGHRKRGGYAKAKGKDKAKEQEQGEAKATEAVVNPNKLCDQELDAVPDACLAKALCESATVGNGSIGMHQEFSSESACNSSYLESKVTCETATKDTFWCGSREFSSVSVYEDHNDHCEQVTDAVSDAVRLDCYGGPSEVSEAVMGAYLHADPKRDLACEFSPQEEVLEPLVTPGMSHDDLLAVAMAQLHRSRNALLRAGVQPSFIPEL